MMTQTVIITGGANGVGKALVKKCLDQNMMVITCDIDEQGLKQLEKQHCNQPLDTYVCDVSLQKSCEMFMEQILTKYPIIHGLVNNAGLYYGQSIWDYNDESMDKVINVNVKAPIWLSKLFAKKLMSQNKKGVIVNVASVAGEVGSSDAVYGMVKSGVIGLTKSFAMNFAPNIRVNVVSPGLITNTWIADQIPKYRYEEYQRQELLDEAIIPEDIANVCLFLLSNEAKVITGTIIRADNGCYPR